LEFARPSEPEVLRVPAERIVEAVHHLLAPQLEKRGVALHLETGGPTWVQVDTQQIKQVLINLIQNAAQSIERSGTIRLRVKPDTAEIAGRVRPAAIFQVVDTGKGIPPEVHQRIFDPFFTTKDGSSGLGLAIAARIVEKHGGLLRFETQLNRGTTFEVVVPRIEEYAT
jgi:signal transduction histidine kinase